MSDLRRSPLAGGWRRTPLRSTRSNAPAPDPAQEQIGHVVVEAVATDITAIIDTTTPTVNID